LEVVKSEGVIGRGPFSVNGLVTTRAVARGHATDTVHGFELRENECEGLLFAESFGQRDGRYRWFRMGALFRLDSLVLNARDE